MSDQDDHRLKGSIKGDGARAERLAAELRRNLQRRKQRSRALAAKTGSAAEAPAPGSAKKSP